MKNELDRHIAWPGKAVASKLGELEIRRLGDDARTRLGARFDLEEFHYVVLCATQRWRSTFWKSASGIGPPRNSV